MSASHSAWLIVIALTACSSSAEIESSEESSEAPSTCAPLLTPLAGTYAVTGVATEPASRGTSTEEHARRTVLVASDGTIDFDTARQLPAATIQTCYDRAQQETDRRVQLSYGADDDGPVVNLYVAADKSTVEEIQYRDRTGGVNVRVLVGPRAP